MVKYKGDIYKAFFQQRIQVDRTKKDLYITLPKMLQDGREGDERICKRLIYEPPGCKRTPQLWYRTVRDVLREMKFETTVVDSCVFLLRDANAHLCALLYMHVDDNIAFCQNA